MISLLTDGLGILAFALLVACAIVMWMDDGDLDDR